MSLCTKLVAPALLLLFFVLVTPSFLSVTASPSSIESMFSIIWITDTQYLSEKSPHNFNVVCNWIVDNSEVLNTKAVIHTGDIVENPLNIKEWNRANHSMSILLNNDIPYCWNAGYHDKFAASWYGKNYAAFNTTIMWETNYWTGNKLDGKNTAIHFEVSNLDFLIINLEFQPNFEALQWANHLLELYPNHHTIIATHAYMNGTGMYPEWTNCLEQKYFEQNVLAKHPNVFMTLNGHFGGDSRSKRTFIDDRHELFFNYQHINGGQGDSSIRILTFSREEDEIFVNTYNPISKQFLTDAENHFILDIPFFRNPDTTVKATENPTLTRNQSTVLNQSNELLHSTEPLEFPPVVYPISFFAILIVPIILKKRKTLNS